MLSDESEESKFEFSSLFLEALFGLGGLLEFLLLSARTRLLALLNLALPFSRLATGVEVIVRSSSFPTTPMSRRKTMAIKMEAIEKPKQVQPTA